MQTRFGHIQFNVQPANLPFYRDLLTFLGWPVIFEEKGMSASAGRLAKACGSSATSNRSATTTTVPE